MQTRIQFRVTTNEWETIAKRADAAQYPSISQFVKDMALGVSAVADNQISFSKLYAEVRQAVEDRIAVVDQALKDGIDDAALRRLRRFVLREIVPGWSNIPQHTNTPTGTIPKPLRASLGKQFYSQVLAGAYDRVRCTNKLDSCGTMIYEIYEIEADSMRA